MSSIEHHFMYLEKQSKLFYSNRTYHTKKKMVASFCTLHPPPPKTVSWLYSPIPSGLKAEKMIQTSLDCFTSNASFVQTEYQWIISNFKANKFCPCGSLDSGVLYNHLITKHSGSSSSALVMTPSLNLYSLFNCLFFLIFIC